MIMQNLSLKTRLQVTVLVIFYLLIAVGSALGGETSIFKDIVTSGGGNWDTKIGEGEFVVWTHNIPADVLAKATRGGIIIGAQDVDYPNCCLKQESCPSERNPYLSKDQCEHDMLSVNGAQVGYLEGENNSQVTFELTIPIKNLKAGENIFKIDADDLSNPIDWVLMVNYSELYLYYDDGVEVPGPGTDPDSGTDPVPSADIDIIKRQSQSKVLPGMRQIYQFEITNTGDLALTGLKVTDELDKHLKYISDTSSGNHTFNGRQHRWTFNRGLKPKERLSFNIITELDVDVLSGIPISNRAYAWVDQLPDGVASNTVTAYSSFVAVAPDGIRVTKRVIGSSVRIGSLLTYVVTIENTSLGRLFNLELEDVLPRGFSIVPGRVVRDGALFKDPTGSRHLMWDLGNLGQKASTTLKYQVVVGANAKKGRNKNSARAKAIDGGRNIVTGEDSAFVNIGGSPLDLGRIEVQVFEDNNGNGRQNAEDNGLKEIGLLLADGQKKITDAEGMAVFEDVRPGHNAVAVDERTLPPESKLIGDSSKLVRVMEGEFVEVYFPVSIDRRPARLQGRVFIDRNNNKLFDNNELLVPSFEAELVNSRKTKGKNGRFVFANIPSGTHTLIVRTQGQSVTVPINLSRGRNKQDIPIPFSGIRFIVEEHNR